jgi:hypothetical protein
MANRSLFLSDYAFRGAQSEKVEKLVEIFDKESGSSIFDLNVDLFIFASLIGCFHDQRSKPDKGEIGKKISAAQFSSHSREIQLAYKLILLTGGKYHIDSVSRLNRTFRTPETKDNEDMFEEYMLGGIDILYDHFIVSTNIRYDNYLVSLSKLIHEFAGNLTASDRFDLSPSTENFF